MWTPSAMVFAAFAALSGLLCWIIAGPAAVERGALDTLYLIASIAPQVALGLLIAGFVVVLLPRERVVSWIGPESGLRGLTIAAAIGAVMPGGPFAFFPLILAISRSGADMGAVLALLVAWAAIGIQRLFVWELPLMGADFSVIRFVASLPLPIIAGLIARRLVVRLSYFGRLEGDP